MCVSEDVDTKRLVCKMTKSNYFVSLVLLFVCLVCIWIALLLLLILCSLSLSLSLLWQDSNLRLIIESNICRIIEFRLMLKRQLTLCEPHTKMTCVRGNFGCGCMRFRIVTTKVVSIEKSLLSQVRVRRCSLSLSLLLCCTRRGHYHVFTI